MLISKVFCPNFLKCLVLILKCCVLIFQSVLSSFFKRLCMKIVLVIISLYQKTALHLAAGKDHTDIVEYLVDKGPTSINSQDKDGVSMLYLHLST